MHIVRLAAGLMFKLQLTDFKKLLEAEFVKLKAGSSSVAQNHPLMRQFKEAVWVCFLDILEHTLKSLGWINTYHKSITELISSGNMIFIFLLTLTVLITCLGTNIFLYW